jgi:hypothetical protein
MCVEPEPLDNIADFERELEAALARRPAPPDLKRKIVGRLWQQAGRSRRRMIWMERIAASLILAAVAGGAGFWHHEVEKRRAEEARQQVFTALRVAGQALQQVNAQLTDHDRDTQ